jgi:DNA polymerase epsilon subunit 3
MAERPEDLNLPNSVIAKIIKDALPDGVNVSKDARLAISKAASVFVLYSTSCANNFATQNKRKMISAQDVFEAMKEMEFEQFIEPLQRNLEAYRKGQKGKKDATEKRKKEKGTSSAVTAVGNDDEEQEVDDEGEVEEGEENEAGGDSVHNDDDGDDVE